MTLCLKKRNMIEVSEMVISHETVWKMCSKWLGSSFHMPLDIVNVVLRYAQCLLSSAWTVLYKCPGATTSLQLSALAPLMLKVTQI